MKAILNPYPLRDTLEELYLRYNRREYAHPDPLEFLYEFDDLGDREVVGLVASSLAYGRVGQILKSVSSVIVRMPSPSSFLDEVCAEVLAGAFTDFKHRFTRGDELWGLLMAIKYARRKYGTLYTCFMDKMSDEDDTIFPALMAFAAELAGLSGGYTSLLSNPEAGSACKRLNLFLRWMVREDAVDPGGWHGVPASKLIVPLDTHMHRIALRLGLTRRRQAGMLTALEVTRAFREIAPEDPVRYDFALTRYGIRGEEGIGRLLREHLVMEIV